MTKTPPITAERLLLEVCLEFQVKRQQILGPGRPKHVARARQALMYLLRHYAGWTFTQIGEQLHRDHSSAVYGVQETTRRLESCPRTQGHISRITARCFPPEDYVI